MLQDAIIIVVGTISTIAFCALIAAPIYFFTEKTEMGQRFKDMTPWLGWTEDEDDTPEFRIHHSNFLKVPSSR